MAELSNYYSLLGVQPLATPAEVSQAYASQVAANVTDPTKLLQLSTAFQVLADPQARARYDQERAGSSLPIVSEDPPVIVGDPSNLSASGPAIPGANSSSLTTSPDRTVIAGQPTGSVTQMVAAPLDAGNRTEMVTIAPEARDRTEMVTNATCPICGTVNAAGPLASAYCVDCGFLLSQAVGEVPAATGSVVRLVSVDGVREYPLRDGENVVGRVDADVLLPDLTVSRVHARLTLTGTMLMVEDANSTNGSKVDGSRLQPGTPVRLADGSQVQFGQVALRVDGLGGDKPIDETGRPAGSGVFIDADAFKTPEEPEVARLVAMSGAKSYPIYSYPASVGRRADNAVVIADPFISGRHAEIIQTPEGIVVRDLGSTNGTIIGSEPLLPDDSAAIRPGTIVQFGKQRFQFVVPESGAGTGSPSVLGSEANGSETSSPADDETDSQTVLPSNPPTPPGTDPVPPVQDTSGEHNVQ